MNKKEFTMDALSDEELDCVVGGGAIEDVFKFISDNMRNCKSNSPFVKILYTVKQAFSKLWNVITCNGVAVKRRNPGKAVPGIIRL